MFFVRIFVVRLLAMKSKLLAQMRKRSRRARANSSSSSSSRSNSMISNDKKKLRRLLKKAQLEAKRAARLAQKKAKHAQKLLTIFMDTTSDPESDPSDPQSDPSDPQSDPESDPSDHPASESEYVPESDDDIPVQRQARRMIVVPEPVPPEPVEPEVDAVSSVIDIILQDPSNTSLHDNQRRASMAIRQAKLEGGSGFALIWALGSGKTRAALAGITSKRTLIVAPLSVIPQWVAEAKRLGLPRVHVYHGAQRRIDPTASINITTIGIISSDFKKSTGSTKERRRPGGEKTHWLGAMAPVFDEIIIDEAHMLSHLQRRRGESRRLYAFAFDRLIKRPVFVTALTGTPYRSSGQDIGSILMLLGEEPTNQMSFKQMKLQLDRISDVVTAEQVGEMPKEVHKMIECEPETKEVGHDMQTMLRAIIILKSKLQGWTRKAHANPALWVKVKQLKLKLFVATTEARLYATTRSTRAVQPIKKTDSAKDRRAKVSASKKAIKEFAKLSKVEKVKEIISKHKGKVVITSDYLIALDGLAEVLPVNTLLFSGRLSLTERAVMLDKFANSDEHNVLLLSKGSGGVGLNLRAKLMIIFEPALTDSRDAQVTGRVVRRGHQGPIRIMHFVTSNSIESNLWVSNKTKACKAAIFDPETHEKRLRTVYGVKSKDIESEMKEIEKLVFVPPAIGDVDKQERDFKEGEQCVVCMDQPATVKAKPCSHKVLCLGCVKRLPKDENGRPACPMCRVSIEGHFLVKCAGCDQYMEEEEAEGTTKCVNCLYVPLELPKYDKNDK